MIYTCDGCGKDAEVGPPARIWMQNEDTPEMLVRASLCRSCLVAMLRVVRPDLRPRTAPQACQEASQP